MHIIHRKSCRVCGSNALTKVIDLGEQYLQGSFTKPGREQPPTRKIPTILVRCDPTQDENSCGLLQLAHTLPPELLYWSYWYRSGTNQTMREHLKGIADEAVEMGRADKARVLDVGCNDSTLLESYPKSFDRYGVDPSNIAKHVPRGITVIQDLFPSETLRNITENRLFDIITAIAMFYDLEDPVHFVKEIKKILAPDGLWIFEMSYMPTMLRMNAYDTICHEHLEYYSLAVIENILKRADMKIVKVSLNSINGGSIRCFATHLGSFKYNNADFLETVRLLRRDEFDLELDTDKPYKTFQDDINRHRDELKALLRKLKKQGKSIHVYGASTKGNTILQWCGIDNSLIDFAADRNPDKFGARTLGTEIPIISEQESRDLRPDYYLVLPWHFRQEFVAREQQMLARGGGMIFPLPEIEIFTQSSLSTTSSS